MREVLQRDDGLHPGGFDGGEDSAVTGKCLGIDVARSGLDTAPLHREAERRQPH